MEVVFQDCIREAKAAGRTVLLSSHILAQVEALADRVSIVRHGQIVESGTLAELRHLTRTSITVSTERPAASLATLPGVHDLRTEGEVLRFEVDGSHLPAVMRGLGELGVRAVTGSGCRLGSRVARSGHCSAGRAWAMTT